jgi:hypothetical protein
MGAAGEGVRRSRDLAGGRAAARTIEDREGERELRVKER